MCRSLKDDRRRDGPFPIPLVLFTSSSAAVCGAGLSVDEAIQRCPKSSKVLDRRRRGAAEVEWWWWCSSSASVHNRHFRCCCCCCSSCCYSQRIFAVKGIINSPATAQHNTHSAELTNLEKRKVDRIALSPEKLVHIAASLVLNNIAILIRCCSVIKSTSAIHPFSKRWLCGLSVVVEVPFVNWWSLQGNLKYLTAWGIKVNYTLKRNEV